MNLITHAVAIIIIINKFQEYFETIYYEFLDCSIKNGAVRKTGLAAPNYAIYGSYSGAVRKTGLVEKRGWQHQIIPYMGRIAGLSEKRGWQNWFQMTPQIIPYMGRLGGLAEKRGWQENGVGRFNWLIDSF